MSLMTSLEIRRNKIYVVSTQFNSNPSKNECYWNYFDFVD